MAIRKLAGGPTLRRAVSKIIEIPRATLLPPSRITHLAGRVVAERDEGISGATAPALQMEQRRRILSFRQLVGSARGRLALLGILLAAASAGGWWTMIRMPGKSFSGPLPRLTEEQAVLRDALRADLDTLAGRIGERNLGRYDSLVAATRFIADAMTAAGYAMERQEFDVAGRTCVNLSAELAGRDRPGEIVVVGAHYDTVPGCPGANDNGTGVVATLALARALRGLEPGRTLRFLFFANEEPPYFQTDSMGSLVYALACRQRGENIVAMISLETIGYFDDAKGSQSYPPPFSLFYPSTGNFIAFVGNYSSRRLVRSSVASFRRHADFPSEGAALPAFIPGVGWSDQWAFWQAGYPALMVTDTAPFRYPDYHRPSDTPDKIDYERMARVVGGLEAVVRDLVRAPKE